jgi:hypothetical protein
MGPPADWVKVNVLRTVSTSYLRFVYCIVLHSYCKLFSCFLCSFAIRIDLIQLLQYLIFFGSSEGPIATVESLNCLS